MITISPELASELAKHIREYPLLFKRGGDVIDHLMLSYGIGCEWTDDGDFVDVVDDGNTEDEFSSFEAYKRSHDWLHPNGYTHENIVRISKEYSILMIIREEAEERAKDVRVTLGYVSDPCQFSAINTLPENAKYIWQEAAWVARNMLDWYPTMSQREKWMQEEPLLVKQQFMKGE